MSDSPYTDLDRPPLHEAALNRALVRPGGLWREIHVVAETGSTNADVAARAREGAPEGLVVVAEAQTAGRGRLDRTWTAPPRSGLFLSVLLRPDVPAARQGLLPLLAGVAVVRAVRRVTEAEAVLKWPNDVQIGERKLAGVLAERAGDAVVVGIGLNAGLRAEELPVPTATSLALQDAPHDRDPLLRSVLRELAGAYEQWRTGTDERLRTAYRAMCVTLGRSVRVERPGGATLVGEAHDIDDTGRLLVRTPEGEHALSSGDVVHVRPAGR